MSFRIYPKYVAGNPQLRIFLPNFWMKLMKPKTPIPSNVVQFLIPLEMTEIDVKNYLEKIYKVPVLEVIAEDHTGDFKKTHKNYLIKEDDYRIASVTLVPGQKFEFPDVYPESKLSRSFKADKATIDVKNKEAERAAKNADRGDVPSWFGI